MRLNRNLTRSVQQQHEKLFTIRANVMNIGTRYGPVPYGSVPQGKCFQKIAGRPELAAEIRVQATFAIFHYGEIAGADARAAELVIRLNAFLDATN